MARFLVVTEVEAPTLVDVHPTGAVAVYKVPTLFCEGDHPGGRLSESFTKGLKYGWWVCRVCHKPKKQYWDNILNDCGLGKNLLNEV